MGKKKAELPLTWPGTPPGEQRVPRDSGAVWAELVKTKNHLCLSREVKGRESGWEAKAASLG